MFVRLKPRKGRPHVDQVIQELRREFAKVPGISAYLQNPPPIRIGGQLTKSLYQFTLQGPDTGELYASAQKLEGKLKGLADLQDVTSDLQVKNPQVNVQIDRDKAASQQIKSKMRCRARMVHGWSRRSTLLTMHTT
jgi:HAE1 family hydrophobic/amphiphilic exporter-1